MVKVTLTYQAIRACKKTKLRDLVRAVAGMSDSLVYEASPFLFFTTEEDEQAGTSGRKTGSAHFTNIFVHLPVVNGGEAFGDVASEVFGKRSP